MDQETFTTIQSSEAKAHWSKIMRGVKNGESYSISFHGEIIGDIIPKKDNELEKKKQSMKEFMELRKSLSHLPPFSVQEILEMRDEGRR